MQNNTMQQLHPRAFWLFLINKVLGWGGFLSIILIVSFVQIGLGTNQDLVDFSRNFMLSLIVLLALILAVAPLWAYLFYRSYKYKLGEEGYRAEWGVIWKHYISIPYERIQNVDITRGILDRLLGLSHLHIQTAGYGGVGMRGGGSEGSVPGIAQQVAEDLRQELMRRTKTGKTNSY